MNFTKIIQRFKGQAHYLKEKYCRCGDIREVLIFASFARRTNSRIQVSRDNYYYISATKENWKFANIKPREKSQNQNFAKMYTREYYLIYSIHCYRENINNQWCSYRFRWDTRLVLNLKTLNTLVNTVENKVFF